MTEVVVVTEPAEEPVQSTPVAVAEAVTPGELAARLELLESRLDERLSGVAGAAYDAQATAEEARETAEVAAVIAAVTAEQAQDEAEPETEAQHAEVDGDGDQEEADSVRAPERRSEERDQGAASAGGEAPKKSGGYGAGWLSGRR